MKNKEINLIKRPLLWVLIGFVLGEVLTLFNMYVMIVIITALFITIFSIWHYLNKNYRFNSYDSFIFIIPMVIYFGYTLMNNQLAPNTLDDIFEQSTSVVATGKVTKIEDKGEKQTIYIKKCKVLLKDNYYLCKQILIYISSNYKIKLGQEISVTGEINKFQKPRNLGQFDEYLFYKTQDIEYKIFGEDLKIIDYQYSIFNNTLTKIKQIFKDSYQKILNEKDAGTVMAMNFGDKSGLELDIKELYQKNGIIHILAISGQHITLIGMSIYIILKYLGVNIYISSAIAIPATYAYGQLTDLSVSTNRAVIMLIIALIANILGRTYDILSAISLSALIILAQQPMQIYNAGFLLSYGAVVGIVVINPILTSYIKSKNIILKAFILSLSVNIIIFPIIIYFYYEFPLYSIFLNLIVNPLMTLLVPLSLIGGIIAVINTFCGQIIIGSVHYILEIYEYLCKIFSKLPASNIVIGKPHIAQVLIYYLIVILFIVLAKYINKKAVLFILIFLSVILIKNNNKGLEITFLDVGQGDAIFIKTFSKTFLVDCGSSQIKQLGKYRILPFLKAKAVDKIDNVIISHMDTDHISGIIELIPLIKIDTIYIPITNLIDDQYTDIINLAKEYSIEIKQIERGDIINDKEITIECLHPFEGFIAKDKNEYSTVLSIQINEFKGLLVGDLEENQEKILIPNLSSFTLLKVGHHGSKTSTSKSFLDKVNPTFSIISCGINNRYNHPSKEIVDRLENNGTIILETDVDGGVTVITDGNTIDINTYYTKRKIHGEFK